MTSYFASMIDVVSAHPYYAYSAIFLAALSEAIPLVGTVVPGSTLVLQSVHLRRELVRIPG